MADPDTLFLNAKRKVHQFTIPFITNKEEIYNDGAEMFEIAGDAFKYAKRYAEAIDAYKEACKYYSKIKDTSNAINCHKYISQLYIVQMQYQNAINTCLQLVEHYREDGKFLYIAKTYITIAELYEKLEDVDNAMKHYRQAIEYYEIESTLVTYAKYYIILADYYALKEKYNDAIDIYEKIAKQYIETTSLKFQTRGLLVRSILCCLLCKSIEQVNNKLHIYEDIDISFYDKSKEHKLANNVIMAIQTNNIDLFQQTIDDYDALIRLDKWYIAILLRIKKIIEYESLA